MMGWINHKPVISMQIGDAEKTHHRFIRFYRFQNAMFMIWMLLFLAAICAPFFIIAMVIVGVENG